MTERALTTQPADERRPAWRRRAGRAATAAAVAVGAPGLVTLLAFTHPHPSATPALLYLVAVMAATAAGGLWAGLLASAASFVPLIYYFIGPRETFSLPPDSAVALGVFLAAALSGSFLQTRQRRLHVRAEQRLEYARHQQQAADALATALTPQAVLDATLGLGMERAEVCVGAIATLSDDGEWLDVVATSDERRRIAPSTRFPVADDLPLSEAVRTREGVYLRSERERDERYPHLAARPQSGHALACLPLTVDRGVVGGIAFSFGSDQQFPPERRALKTALARQAAVALERVRLLERERTLQARLSFLGEATAILASSLDYERTLARLADLAVPTVADWCAVDMLSANGDVERLLVAHRDPQRRRAAEQSRRPRADDESGPAGVIRSGQARFVPEAAPADEAAVGLAGVDLRSYLCVPLAVGMQTPGALTLATEGERVLTEQDFELARELASRAAIAVENARLYREAEQRADAALALEYVGDGVVLLDRAGRIRYWNTAIAATAGVSEPEALGRRIGDVVPGWSDLVGQVKLAEADTPARARPATVPFAAGDEERWLSIAGVAFEAGAVYAVRDVSEERALERARGDFVATASHELRTPLAAVYGAARTLRRPDLDLLPEQRDTFLEIIEEETERLTAIVSQILLAGQLDGGRVDVAATTCDLQGLVESVVASARLRSPGVELRLDGDEPVRAVADEDKLRQVLVNLVDNAVKYSPDGGEVVVELRQENGRARVSVRDRGLGIPAAEQERIFEKFYRLDPEQTRGVGGSGLGLYISRELVTRMGGRLAVESSPGAGSTFSVELPAG